MAKISGGYLIVILLLFCSSASFAQSTLNTGNPGQPTTISNAPQRDTSMNKTNNNKWKDEEVRISYERLSSSKRFAPDSGLHTFHRRPFTQPWAEDLGNLGSPVNSLFFTPEYRVGPSLGYHVFDPYRYFVDSLKFYSTTRPYSVFRYQLGSRLEQIAGIMHTQNVRPNWNFAVEYRRITSPGFYRIQRNNDDNGSVSTNYKSLNKHYTLYGAMVYNKEQHDENGGIVADSQLSDPKFVDRRTIDVGFQNPQYGQNYARSTVTNQLRDFSLLLQQSYTWGHTDTTYNKDSTQYSFALTPRFGITHKFALSTEKHTFNDVAADSARYTNLFQRSFSNNGSGSYAVGGDSVFVQQKWFWIDNKILLNGFIGKEGKQLQFSAGLGNRYDQFISLPIKHLIYDSLPKQIYATGVDRSSTVSNYLTGEVKKEALNLGEWEYGANALLFLTGAYAGNFNFQAAVGKELKTIQSSFTAGFKQQLNSAPYSYTNYENIYTRSFYNFDNESVSQLYASLESVPVHLSAGLSNYVVANYIYFTAKEQPAQYTVPFNILQAWVSKVFTIGNFHLDNELTYQQLPDNAPVNIPAVLGRHQLSFESPVFKRALRIATGIEVRYNSSYNPAGYDPLLNRFYYQNTAWVANTPQIAIFLNFKIKRFRAFIMGDQMQQIFSRNTILFPSIPIANWMNRGQTIYPFYAAPNTLLRFGFSWPLVN